MHDLAHQRSASLAGPHSISRRRFLGLIGVSASSAALAGCATPAPRPPEGRAPAASQVDGASANAPAPMLRPRVAVAQTLSYGRAEVRRSLRAMLDQLGGLKGVVRSRDRVVIKTNLTGGLSAGSLPGIAPVDSFVTHPAVVRALAEAVKEAGARDVTIVESVYEWPSFVAWGYEQVADDLGLKLVDLNGTAPFKDYVKKSPGSEPFVYDHFVFNPILEECDVFMSVPKMKCHYTAGITLSMKNLVGLVPARFYRLTAQHNHRSALHGPGDEGNTRIPRVIVDLNRTRPIHFALIDGIQSTEGGEGPWIGTMQANAPHVLVAGVNALATDTVATALMGFDAAAPAMHAPFVRGDNHFELAAARGLGTHRLADIDVFGPPIEDIKVRFRTA